jgi:DNA-binding transcriptional regulator YdaS (Cro superfamily)
MENNEIIDLLGGTTKVARLCGVSVPAASQWRKFGIPKDRLIFLAASIEKLSGGKYTRKQMFPDTWQDIWVELRKVRTRMRK